ncbi:MAG: hydrogen peroxide-inducible genes activator [Verrucomicrobium sp.]|nr:hydrogen peroxide-inducible genes activator [Verrucomicrobium sp.]
MELQQLRYFVAVADQRGFTRAARLCHITQPTLSHQIKKLEEEMGEPLFQRRRKGASLTPLGESVYRHAQEILRGVDSVRHAASSFSQGVQGRLKIGVIPTIAPYLMPDLLRRAQKRHPGLQLEMTEEPSGNLLAALRSGALDLAILSPPAPGDQVELLDLFEDEFLLALPVGHRLARTRALSLDALREAPMILMNDVHCLRGQAISFCQRSGFVPNVSIQSSQLDTVVALVEGGQGVSLVPALARKAFRHRKVLLRSLQPDRISRRISLAWSRQMAPSRAFSAFVELCRAGKPKP